MNLAVISKAFGVCFEPLMSFPNGENLHAEPLLIVRGVRLRRLLIAGGGEMKGRYTPSSLFVVQAITANGKARRYFQAFGVCFEPRMEFSQGGKLTCRAAPDRSRL